MTDFVEVAYQTKEVIAHQFGEQTLIHYALAAIAFQLFDKLQKLDG